MNVPGALLAVLFVLMLIIGGKRGVKSFFTLFLNFVVLFALLILIAAKLNPIKVTVIGCIIISSITLFYINGFNKKTISSLISVTLVILATMAVTYKMGENAKLQGFGFEQLENIAYLSLSVNIDFSQIFLCQVLIGLLGAIIDVSISISSSMNELYKNDLSITKYSLFSSGINIGKDVMGTMTNTLFFAFIGGFLTLIIYMNELHYSFSDILNAKVFGSEVFQIMCGGIGIIFIIPITAFITSMLLFFEKPLKK